MRSLKRVSPATMAGRARFFAYRRPEEVQMVLNDDLIREWQDSALVQYLIYQVLASTFRNRATASQMRVLHQFAGPDHRAKLWAVILDRGIESEADNFQIQSK